MTVDPRGGSYGFTLSPPGLEFTPSSAPTVDFSYGLYGDLAVADGVQSFADRSAYAAALEVWEEVTIDGWRIARDSSPSGVDAVESAVAASGTFVVAARR